MKVKQIDNDVYICNYKNFDIEKTLECGQCFRWKKQIDGSYIGTIYNKVITIIQTIDNIIFKNLTIFKYKNFIENYFDFNRDYNIINQEISKINFLNDACKFSNGIRILKQDPWETLISFIISQNNNIPRIKEIINKLAVNFGKQISGEYFSFPNVDDLKDVTIKDLSVLKCGFRDKYIIDAVKKISQKEIVLSDLYNMDVEKAREKLKTIKGVGNKVADCTLLYGFAKMDCFPKDVWIRRTMEHFFKTDLPPIKKEYLGVAQQYIFYYVRSNPNILFKN